MQVRCLRCLRFDLNVSNVSTYMRCIPVYVCDTLQNDTIHVGDEFLNKVVIFWFLFGFTKCFLVALYNYG